MTARKARNTKATAVTEETPAPLTAEEVTASLTADATDPHAVVKAAAEAWKASDGTWSVVASRSARFADEHGVIVDGRSQGSKAAVAAGGLTVSAYAKLWGVSSARVAVWRRAGHALTVCTESEVRSYLRAPGTYDTETVDRLLAAGSKTALRQGLAERSRTLAERKANAAADRAAKDANKAAEEAEGPAEPTVTRERDAVTMRAVDYPHIILAAIARMGADDLLAYGVDNLPGLAETLRETVATIEALHAEHAAA